MSKLYQSFHSATTFSFQIILIAIVYSVLFFFGYTPVLHTRTQEKLFYSTASSLHDIKEIEEIYHYRLWVHFQYWPGSSTGKRFVELIKQRLSSWHSGENFICSPVFSFPLFHLLPTSRRIASPRQSAEATDRRSPSASFGGPREKKYCPRTDSSPCERRWKKKEPDAEGWAMFNFNKSVCQFVRVCLAISFPKPIFFPLSLSLSLSQQEQHPGGW